MKRGGGIDFGAEAAERIETAKAVLSLRRAPRIGEINELFRAAHSLKGLAGLAELDRVARCLHEAESLLDSLRLSKIEWSDGVRRALSEFFELLDAAIPGVAAGSDEGFPEERALRLISGAGRGGAAVGEEPLSGMLDLPAATLSCLSEYEESRLRVNLKNGAPVFTLDVSFSLEDFERGLKELGERLNERGEWIATLPQVSGFSPDRLAVQLLAALPAELADLGEEIAARRVSREAAPPPGPSRATRAAAARSIRVETSRMEALLSSAQDAYAAFARFAEAAGRLEGALSSTERAALAPLRRRAELTMRGLAREAAEMRTAPMSRLAERLARATERLVRTSGKRAVFRVRGGDVEIDRAIAEELADPLLHLLRNAIDHGLEAPEERRAAGKPEEGTITLMARARSARLLVSISDDGRGIQDDRVLERARELGWIAPGHRPQPEELHALLFRPGFSTAAKVSEISGRGVGLDLVADRVAARGGAVRVMSEPGRGARFELEVPIAAAVFEALIVSEGKNVYAVPLAAVRRLSPARPGDRSLGGAMGASAEESPGRVRLELGDDAAISVERVLGQELVTVRPIAGVPIPDYVMGASDGAERGAVLVIDPKRLLRPRGGQEAA